MNSTPGKAVSPQAANPLSRRRLFAGASGLGAVAAVASLVPLVGADSPAAPALKPAPLKGGGYTLSEHVKQYYKTTLI